MEWIVTSAEELRGQIRQGPFFRSLERATDPKSLGWVHQLLHQSREFTQALCLRYSLCHDRNYQGVFAEHAFEEADHPDQLITWMDKHGFLQDPLAGSLPTLATLNSLAYCWRVALREPHDVQVVALNVLSEGVALDFYSAVIPVLSRLGLLSGRYWKVHREVDATHLRLGLDRIEPVTPEEPRGRLYLHHLWAAANLYHRMLTSWVGAAEVPLLRPPAALASFLHLT